MVLLLSGLSCGVFVVLAWLILTNFKVLTGATNNAIYLLPALLIAVVLGGAVQALWLRTHRPTAYARIGSYAEID